MTEALELLSRLASIGVRLSADRDRLSCHARGGVLTAELRDGIVKHKHELIELLRSGGSNGDDAHASAPAPVGKNTKLGPQRSQLRQLPRPQSSTELIVTALWEDILKVDRVGIDEDFFRIGGTSMLAMEVIAAIREHFQIDLSARQLIAEPTIRHIAANIDEALQCAEAAERSSGTDARWVEGLL